MNRRLITAGLAATGGLLTTAFLQVAVAAAAPGDDAFTIGSYVFDPINAAGVEGFNPVYQLTTSPPLLELGGGTALGLPLATQNFDVYSPGGAELGSIQGNETVTNLFGFTNAEFTVAGVTAADGGDASSLPAIGSVYDAWNFGGGYENIYVATPGDDGTVTDTFITPTGQSYDLSSLFTFNAANPLNPGDAFTGLEAHGITGAPEAFTIAGTTLDPINSAGTEGFNTVAPLATTAPLLVIGGTSLGDPSNGGNDLATQIFDVYSGSGSSAAEIGTINTGVDVTNLLGLTNTQLIVTDVTPAGVGSADLPTVGSVYDALNFGGGFENVYTATPGALGSVTDNLVTPYGTINLTSLFENINVANPLNPADALTGLQAGDSAIGANAFTLDGLTFNPLTADFTQPGDFGLVTGEGFNPVYQLTGAAPLLNLGGGTPTLDLGFGPISLTLAQQDFNVYDGAGNAIGAIDTNDQVTNLLGLTNAEFTVTHLGDVLSVPGDSSSIADLIPAADGATLPAVGTVYDVLNLGGGVENIYTAIPGLDGAASTIHDILVTPLGNLDLGSLFGGIDATALLNPGDAFTAGLEALTNGLTEAGAGAATAFDPLSFLGL
ncbi:hypothetical protein PT015_18540 [Candidatus Mycobacterium wuenschmannii]|uniref:PPE family protein n=1 Tax=Candidatus Mycobacterium wuenschmannii TaxID=3027808 RepID=A0ABY8VTC2_9MYCO|nr:hypothetical protein [Candidatus Mycobacterium wuenschmannii]WIM86863.1 hypothetical protein PT015_18540 [Candidatus Mycobacterium wuenschmannii]